MRIHITTGKKETKPASGDIRIIKGIAHVRQQVYSKLHRAYLVNNGRPVWEWVVKDSAEDRSASRGKS